VIAPAGHRVYDDPHRKTELGLPPRWSRRDELNSQVHQIKIATEQNLLLLYDRSGVGLKAFPWRIYD
jgi:hypothetical protein